MIELEKVNIKIRSIKDAERARAWRKKNPERVKENNKNWNKKNRKEYQKLYRSINKK